MFSLARVTQETPRVKDLKVLKINIGLVEYHDSPAFMSAHSS